MSAIAKQSRRSVRHIQAMKGKTPIVCLTAYSAPIARLLDPHVDLFIVGDSLGMVLYGMRDTLGVDLPMMTRHARAVSEHSHQACVVVDMPFGSYQASPEEAFGNAATLLGESGAQAVKLEGGVVMADTVAFLTQRGIPVMGHIGLMPQYVHTMGGYRYQGRDDQERARLLADARAIEEAGAFSVVIEGTDEAVAREITQMLSIPTIGIGASPACDGQVLVTEDILGLSERAPKFAHQFADVGQAIEAAAAEYAKAVRTGSFPGTAHCYGVKTA